MLHHQAINSAIKSFYHMKGLKSNGRPFTRKSEKGNNALKKYFTCLFTELHEITIF